MDSVLNEYSLEREDLDFKCTHKIIIRIAGQIIDEWYFIGRDLDVTEGRLASIRHDNTRLPEDKAVAVLDAWAEEYGEGATCLKLAEALWRRNRIRVIEILCEEVAQMSRDTTTCMALREPRTSNSLMLGGFTCFPSLASPTLDYGFPRDYPETTSGAGAAVSPQLSYYQQQQHGKTT